MQGGDTVTKTIPDIKTGRYVAAACWLVYACAYVGRVNYSAAVAGMVNDGFLKSEVGLIGTAFFLCYGAGQLVSGYFGDIVSPFKMISIGMAGSAAANFAMSLCQTPAQLAVVWGINGILQSMLWSPILRIYGNVINSKIRDKWCLYISASVPVGTLTAYLLSTVSLKFFGWRNIYTVCSAVVFVCAIIWIVTSICASKKLTDVEPEQPGENIKPENKFNSVNKSTASLILISGGVAIMISTAIHGMLKEGISAWVPTMISETYGLSPSFSVFVTLILPIINLAGPYVIAPVYRKYLGGNEVLAACICIGLSAPVFLVLLLVGKLPAIACVVLFAITTSLMHAYNYMIITMVPIRFAKYNKTSFASGLYNSITYFGCAIATYGLGFSAEKYGWTVCIAICIGLALLGCGICVPVIKRWKNFCKVKKVT